MLLEKTDEVAVLGEDNDSGGACRRKDFVVVRIAKSKLPQRLGRDWMFALIQRAIRGDKWASTQIVMRPAAGGPRGGAQK